SRQPPHQSNKPSQLLLKEKGKATTPVKQTTTPHKVRKGKPAFQLVDEEDEAQHESIPQREDDDPDLNLAKKLSLEAHQEKGEEEGNDVTSENFRNFKRLS
ncbi:hypothetical protein Tco_0512784, partial [Tanacetum coccineum]